MTSPDVGCSDKKQSLDSPAPTCPVRDLAAIIMAAGLGKRMRSSLVKVLHRVAGRPMILYAVDLAGRIAGRGVTVVVGPQGDRVKEAILTRGQGAGSSQPVKIVEQKQPLGTGHAVMQARAAVTDDPHGPASAFLILNGDTPLLSEATVLELWRVHETEDAAVTILTALLDDPTGYGRVVRKSSLPEENTVPSGQTVSRIVEDRDTKDWEARIKEVNVGTYIVNAQFLFEALDKIQPKNAQGEYYLTDLIGMAVERGLRVSVVTLRHPTEGLGINSRQQLAEVQRVLREKISAHWLAAGVTLHDPATAWIDADVTIGMDTELHPHVTLEGATTIGENCTLRSHVRLSDCMLGDKVVIQDCCVLREAKLEEGATIGPFAHLRPGTVVRRNAKVGNFVEVKQTDLGESSKANHLSYLGNARIGKKVNIGAGTITCNYDGAGKHETLIEDEVFVGSNAIFVAPVQVGRGSLVAAGSTITENIPKDALAIARTVQVNRPEWAARRRALPGREEPLPGKKRSAQANKSMSPSKRPRSKTGRKR